MIKLPFSKPLFLECEKKVCLFGEDGEQRSFREPYCLNYLILITNLALTHLQHVLLHHKIYTFVTIIRARGGYRIIFLVDILLIKVLIP